MTPRPLGPSRWGFSDPGEWGPFDCLGPGGDLEPATIVAAYSAGVFPMPDLDDDARLYWWSPLARGVLRPGRLHVSRSLRRSRRRYSVTFDRAFADVVDACADPERSGAWISREISEAYNRLHGLGWAHSVETWEGDRLVGGLYGLAIGGLFAGESMFHRATDASKVALWGLAELLGDGFDRLIDVQWLTPHLASLGAEEWSREEYLDRLPGYLHGAPLPDVWR